ncbi:MAG: proline iminopeptidase [Oceanotoga sp.]|uniref:alpha/beta fold hydrolase n=1 Tax=Oceanotoga sp. TaxID=2108366 RepID=UPI00264C2E6C|nr:alpha/beta hydrolase [Oceanotoga sp.]MDN5342582.1 proline iminopeptidase [Oceanotoga sp.]
MDFVTSDGIKLYYERKGNGIPCLYLHGGPGYWSKSFQYYAGKYLEKNFDMIYLDQRGCGRSEYSLSKEYSLEKIINDIEELRIFLGIKEWYIIGHSFGGILAVNYAYYFPNRTIGLILSNVTLCMYYSFMHQINKGSEILGIEKPVIKKDDFKSFVDTFYFILKELLIKGDYFKLQFLEKENKKQLDLIDQSLQSDPNFQQYVFSSKEYFQDFTLLTKNIKKPVLVITGEFDDAIGPEHYLSFKFENIVIHKIKSSHHPYIENQIEFKNIIEDFIHKDYQK